MSSSKSKAKNSNKAVDRTLVRRLYRFIKPYKWLVFLAIALTLCASFLGTLVPKLSQMAIDEHITKGDLSGLKTIVGYVMLAIGGEFLLTVATTYITRWFGQGSLYNLRVEVFRKIQTLHVQYFDKNPIGRLITRTTNDIEALSDLFSTGVVSIIGDLLRIIFILYFMLSMNVRLTLIALTVLPLLFYVTFWFKAKVRVAFLQVRDQVAKLNSFVQEHVNGMDIVQLFNRQSKEYERFNKINTDHRTAHIQTIFYFAVFWPMVEMISSFAMALVVWYGGANAIVGNVTIGVLLAFIQYVRQFFRPIQQLSERFNTLQSALAASERIFSVLDVENQIEDTKNPVNKEITKGVIEFNDVWFKYNENEAFVSKGLNFNIKQGETIAIVGATGAGKSTIINLLLRFYDAQKGEIKIDGESIKDYSLKDLRKSIALVLQDNILFSGTVLENITLNNPDISEEAVIKAAKMIGAHQFIDRLPNGYQTVLKEGGGSFSMGQRQLINFLRALVYNPTILILDEATSNIDSETEALVNDACQKLVEGRTSIIIAHRLSTIRHADKIVVMHRGEIREMDSHEKLLLKKDGIYRKLYELQYQDQQKGVA